MSTFTAVGPALSLDGPLPEAPPHSLLKTEGVVVDSDDLRVLNGVNVWGYPTGCSSLWEPCSDGTFRLKDDTSEQPTPRFDAIVVYKPVTCSSIGLRDPDELARRATADLDATLSAAIERALAEGLPNSSNPFFGGNNVNDVTGRTQVSAKTGFAWMEQEIGETCRMGMIHATPATVVGAQTFPVSDTVADRLVTTNGTPIASGMGYQDIDTSKLSTPDPKEDWIFATGPVRVYLGPVVVTSLKETLDRETNDLTYRAERYVLALWDTALQAAALVDWSL